MRGSGDSEGVLRGEYLRQEQDDGIAIIEWLARQPWCSGAVGMIGISWGGFNGLQIAARKPEALKAVISLCSTDDRYADDIHYMGGCLLLDKIAWGSTMFSLNTAPPDPMVVGEKWRDMWMRRLKESGFWIEDWLRHQRRDEFYKHGSVCEDWPAIECPVYAVGGWADGYTNSVLRLVANLKGPRKGLIGPWAHRYPHVAKPGPQIGFLQESLRWWDQWLKGIDTGVMDEPMLRFWLEDAVRPSPHNEKKPGRWIAEPSWPSPNITSAKWRLNPHRLEPQGSAPKKATLSIVSPQTTGLASGKWCAYGQIPDQPSDQRAEMGGQLVFECDPLEESVDVLGSPIAELVISSDKPNALLAATLCEVFPDGAATRISFGILNLTHHNGHETPEPLVPGERYRIKLQLNDIGHRFAAGNRIRLAISNAYWPTVWPSPETAAVQIVCEGSSLNLPIRETNVLDRQFKPFLDVEHAPLLKQKQLEPTRYSWTITTDTFTGETVMVRLSDDGRRFIEDTAHSFATRAEHRYIIKPDDPLSAKLETICSRSYEREHWQVSSETRVTLTSSMTQFHLRADLKAYEGGKLVCENAWSHDIPRDFV
jgi:putative CocE/NonD family hydrolase